MAFEVKKGSFACNTSTGNQVITGVGFQPKALILWTALMTAEGFAAENRGAIGMAVSTSSRRYTAWACNDAVGISDTSLRVDNLLIGLLSSSGVVDAAADLVSFDSGGFTMNWSDAPGSAWIMHYLALGGSDLTNVFIKTFNTPTASGSVPYTGVGFLPDCLIGLWSLAGTVLPYAGANAVQAVSFASSASAEQSCGFGDEDAQDISRGRQWLRPLFVRASDAQDGGERLEGDLTSLDADGFTINYTASITFAMPMAVLCLKGGQYKVGTDTQRTSVGTKATNGVGFQPTGLLLLSANAVGNAADDATKSKHSIGAVSSGVEGCSWFESVDALDTSDTNSSSTTGKVIRTATSVSTIDAEADLSSFDSDGFTLDWTTADATAREFAYLAFGSEPSPPAEGNLAPVIYGRGAA
jgi:hypothetical protein